MIKTAIGPHGTMTKKIKKTFGIRSEVIENTVQLRDNEEGAVMAYKYLMQQLEGSGTD